MSRRVASFLIVRSDTFASPSLAKHTEFEKHSATGASTTPVLDCAQPRSAIVLIKRGDTVRSIALITIVTALALESGAMRAEDINVKKWPADVRAMP
jgi:hypothetical protein